MRELAFRRQALVLLSVLAARERAGTPAPWSGDPEDPDRARDAAARFRRPARRPSSNGRPPTASTATRSRSRTRSRFRVRSGRHQDDIGAVAERIQDRARHLLLADRRLEGRQGHRRFGPGGVRRDGIGAQCPTGSGRSSIGRVRSATRWCRCRPSPRFAARYPEHRLTLLTESQVAGSTRVSPWTILKETGWFEDVYFYSVRPASAAERWHNLSLAMRLRSVGYHDIFSLAPPRTSAATARRRLHLPRRGRRATLSCRRPRGVAAAGRRARARRARRTPPAAHRRSAGERRRRCAVSGSQCRTPIWRLAAAC